MILPLPPEPMEKDVEEGVGEGTEECSGDLEEGVALVCGDDWETGAGVVK